MALAPQDKEHALQIQAGTLGRKAGHQFEDEITKRINKAKYPFAISRLGDGHVFDGDPGLLLLSYIGKQEGVRVIKRATAISTGALATSEEGKKWLSINGANVRRCKSDLIISLEFSRRRTLAVGISTKQCNNKTPTNAQLFFTTARGFANLLRTHGITVSSTAIGAMRQFCGDAGFRPSDDANILQGRLVDPRRFFWEEINVVGRIEWERLLARYQDDITRLLLQKAYIEDEFVPEYMLHKTKRAARWKSTEVAIYAVEDFIRLSRGYQRFATKPYSVRKGSHKDPPGIQHLAPRFGVVQMQRGGQKQHPEQLQFNLEAGYFYKI